MKKVIAGICVLLAVCITVFAASATPVYTEKKAEKVHQARADRSINAYQQLTAYLAKEEVCSADLAAVYAGAYLNDAGDLTVNLTADSEAIQAELARATDNAPIAYQIVEKSLAELREVCGILSAHLTDAPYFEVVLSETKNTVEVYTEADIAVCTSYIASLTDVSSVEIHVKPNQIADCAV